MFDMWDRILGIESEFKEDNNIIMEEQEVQ